MNRTLALLSSAALLAVAANAQCFSPTGTSIVGSMTPSLGGYPATDEGYSPDLALGFVFPMAGVATTLTHCVVEANGSLYLTDGSGAVGIPGFGNNYLDAFRGVAGDSPRVVGFSEDQDGGDILVDSSVPGQFKVTWVDYHYWLNSDAYDFSITLFDTGEVQIDFGTDPFAVGSGTCGVGVSIGGGVGTGTETETDFGVAGTTSGLGLVYDLPTSADMPYFAGSGVRFAPDGSGGYAWFETPCLGTLATHTVVGAGCYGSYESIYQLFADAAAASTGLTGNTMLLSFNGVGYDAQWLPGTASAFFVTPVAPTSLGLGDDDSVNQVLTTPFASPLGPVTSLGIGSNGIIGFNAATVSTSYTPAAADFLNSTEGGVYLWHDYATQYGGDIVFEEAGSVAYVTWDAVHSWGNNTANPSTVQVQFDTATGDIWLVFLDISNDTTSTFGSGHLVGYTPPGASPNRGSMNLASALPATISVDAPPMSLSASPRPISTPSSGTLVNFNVTNAPEYGGGFALGVVVLSATSASLPLFAIDPSVDPGCIVRVGGLDVMMPFVGPLGPQTTQFQLPAGVPVGVMLYTQAVALAPGLNNFLGGVALSNGIESLVGDV
ncbi:MAG: hypothetical protein H6835_12610 [Planctomycetes bacterium]|nr:hypothetical protein [Planctomycetota bacterium]